MIYSVKLVFVCVSEASLPSKSSKQNSVIANRLNGSHR
jgi:hypothetical protein